MAGKCYYELRAACGRYSGHHLDPADTDPAAASYVQTILLADMVDIAVYKFPIVPISSQL
jgi:hypothetical protein